MGRYYSPSGNREIWEQKPDGYLTEDEWAALHPPPPPPEPTPEDIIAEYDAALEARIDAALVARGYTKREPSDYAGSVVPRYRQDAIDYELCRDRIMCAGYDMLNEYMQTGRIPSMEEFLAALPTLTWTIDPTNEHPGEGMYIPEGEA